VQLLYIIENNHAHTHVQYIVQYVPCTWPNGTWSSIVECNVEMMEEILMDCHAKTCL
jgi:hypothetical protein